MSMYILSIIGLIFRDNPKLGDGNFVARILISFLFTNFRDNPNLGDGNGSQLAGLVESYRFQR